jgi:hypothetical protein
MKRKLIEKYFKTASSKKRVLQILGIKEPKTHAQFCEILESLSYSKLKTLI